MLTVSQLKERGIRAQKGLGQNFLISEGALTRILNASKVGKQDTVVEVGSGPGILTGGLAERAKKVIAVELDTNLITELTLETLKHKNVEIRNADILKIDPADFPKGYMVVANVPYYITSAIIKHFLESTNRPGSMTLTIQAEVAERIIAEPPKMSILAISVQLYGTPRIAGRIQRTAFWPAPAVDSAILRIDDIGKDLEKKLNGLSEKEFFKVVKAGFASKRKQLHNSLGHNLAIPTDEAQAMLEKADIDSKRRAETLTIAEWVTLGKLYAKT